MPDARTADFSEVFARYLPLLRYDSGERFFATSVAVWTNNAGNELRRVDGTVLAAATPAAGHRQLSLAHLGAQSYADGTPTNRDDFITAPGDERLAHARVLQTQPSYAARVYGHVSTGRDGRVWLAYWFFYLYNDYTLIGPFLKAGRHEGDWEMIQLRLAPDEEVPDLALYTQHSHVGLREWQQVERVGERPVVYVARGCHACYFEPGRHWTGVWFDRADGRGPAPATELELVHDGDPDSAWAQWPGRWGGTQPGHGVGKRLGLDASSPRGPGHQRQWRNPDRLFADVRQPRRTRASTSAAAGLGGE